MFAVDRKGTATVIDTPEEWDNYFAQRAFRARLKKSARNLVIVAGAAAAFTLAKNTRNSDTEND